MTNPKKPVDVVLVGVGWTGGILAAELTKAGMTVVGLERGLPRDTSDWQVDHDELKYAVRHEMMQNPARETWTLRHNLRERALPIRQLGSFLPGIGVGGSGVHWNGMTWRYHPWDFTMRSSTIARYGKNAIPANSTIQDWGITYEELEPYYHKFEYMAGISGKAGNIKGKIQPGGNPFEGTRQGPYPLPPMPRSRITALAHEAFKKVGYHPFPGPSANLPQVYTNSDGITRGACTYCGFCERFGCEVGAKASANVTVLPVAMKTGRFELRTGANVFQIKHDGKHAHSVLYHDALGNVQEQPASIVILTSYVFNNARLLLLSKIGRPYNPDTGKGAVGKNYAYQLSAGASAYFGDRDFQTYMGAGALEESIDDLNADNFDHSGLGFIGGGNIAVSDTGARPIQYLPAPPTTPKWGAQWKAAIRTYHNSSLDVGLQGGVPAYRDHFLDLDPTYRDQWGLPLLRITFDWEENERKVVAFMAPKIKEILRATGAKMTSDVKMLPAHYDTVAYQTTHNTGGVIMGSDPATSVVNNYLQMWDVDNVFVVGASAYPQQAGFNPTGTVCALAYRAADGIVNSYTLAQVRHGQGDLRAAVALLAQADAIYSRLGLTPDVQRCRYTLAQVYLDQGRLEEARPLLAQAGAIFYHFRLAVDVARCRYITALLCQAEGQWDEAVALLTRAETAFLRHGLEAEVARCRYVLAEVRQTQGQREEAITLLREAKALFKAHGLVIEGVALARDAQSRSESMPGHSQPVARSA